MGQMKRYWGMVEVARDLGLHGVATAVRLHAEGYANLAPALVDDLDTLLDAYVAQCHEGPGSHHAGRTAGSDGEQDAVWEVTVGIQEHVCVDTGRLDAMLAEGVLTEEAWQHFMGFDGATATPEMLACATRDPNGMFYLDWDMNPLTEYEAGDIAGVIWPARLKLATGWLAHWDDELEDPASMYQVVEFDYSVPAVESRAELRWGAGVDAQDHIKEEA